MADLDQLARSNRESEFNKEYIKQKGWNENNLSPSQIQTMLNEYNTRKNFRFSQPTTTNTTTSGSGAGGSGGSTGGNAFTNILTATIDAAQKLIETQESKPGTYLPDLQGQLIGVNEAFDIFIDKQTKSIKSPQQIIGGVLGLAAQKLTDYYKEQTILLEDINKKAMLTGKLSEDFRASITAANPRLVQLGVSFQDLAESANKIVQDSGRFALVNQQTLEKAGEVGQAYLGSMQDMVELYDEFEKIGIGAKEANLSIERAGKRSMELGLQSRKVVSDISQNMDKINSYGFKNGIDGLSAMARKAVEFRMSIQEVFTIAEKVMNPEGALELSANLQVLGGAIGDFNDPLKMMYMATNNVEGLQDALIGAAGSLATYNSEQGRFEITGVNLRRAQAMAKEMGISYQQLASGAIAAAERSSAASDMLARGLTLKPEQTEFLTNIARMKDGKMVIDLGGSQKLMDMFGKQEIALDQLTEEKALKLLEYQDELKEKTTEDIARGQATSIENIKRDVNYLALLARNSAGKVGVQLAEEMGVGPTAQKKLAESTQRETIVGGQLVNRVVTETGENLIKGARETKSYITGQNMSNQILQPGATTGTMSVTFDPKPLAKAIVDEQEIRRSNQNPKSGSQNLTVVNDPQNQNSYFVTIK